MMDKEKYDDLFDLVQNLDFEYEILQIDWWESSDQWTVLINNFQNFNIHEIVGDLKGVVGRGQMVSKFEFCGGYFDIVQMESTAEFCSEILGGFEKFILDNEISGDLVDLNVRSFSLTFSS